MLDLKTDTPALRGEDGAIRADFVARVSGAVREADADDLRALVGDLHEADLGAVLETLAPDERPRLIQLLGIDFDFTALTEVDEAVRDEILEGLPPKTVADGVRDLESDDAVAILEGLEHEDRAQILAELPARERIELTRSLDYPEESAGRRMQSDFMAVPAGWNVGRAIDYMRETAELPERFYELFVIDGDGRFLGAVPLARLLRSKRPMPIAELMEQDRPRVHAEQDQEEVARLFQRYNWVAAPVVESFTISPTSSPYTRKSKVRRAASSFAEPKSPLAMNGCTYAWSDSDGLKV